MEFGLALAKEFLAVEEDKRRLENLSESLAYQRFAEELGFKVMVIGDRAFTTAKELMRVFGYKEHRSVHNLLQKHEIRTYTVRDVLQIVEPQGSFQCHRSDDIGQPIDTQQLEEIIRKTFGLEHIPALYRAKFIDYRGFLVLGMYSQAENGDVVRNYLLEAERELRRKAVEGVRSEDEFLRRLKEYAPYLDGINRLIGKLPKKEQGKAAKHTLIMIFGEEIFEEKEEKEALNLRERIVRTIVNLDDLKDMKVKGGYLWVEGKKFIEILKKAGLSIQGNKIKEVREKLGFGVKRSSEYRYTLIPIDFFPADFLNRVGGV